MSVTTKNGKIILVTGGRDFTDRDLVFRILDSISPSKVVHGACGVNADDLWIDWSKMKGADRFADDWAISRKVQYVRCPAHWTLHKRSAGFKRNAEMLKLFKPELVVAFAGNNGTKNMIDIARKAGIEIMEIQ